MTMSVSQTKVNLKESVSHGMDAPNALSQAVDVNLIPDEVEFGLLAPPDERLSPRRLFHRVAPRPGALVSLWSNNSRLQVLRLSVTSDAPGWNPRWVCWTYAVRHVPKDLGGDALAAQDALSAEDRELTLLLLPGESRSATLEFTATLDGESRPGLYPFDVVITDADSGEQTTAAGTLKLRHPASALLASLPAIYGEAVSSENESSESSFERPFFERYLRGFEDQIEPMRRRLSELDSVQDPDEAPAEFLPWLATWAALLLDENWPQLKRRRLIKEVIELYRWRGTRYGLARYLELYTGILPEIHDLPFTGMTLGPQTLLGRDTVLGDVPPHTFVLILSVPDRTKIDERVIRTIIEAEKPAHTAYTLQFAERIGSE